jgi:hypothetical protein
MLFSSTARNVDQPIRWLQVALARVAGAPNIQRVPKSQIFRAGDLSVFQTYSILVTDKWTCEVDHVPCPRI